MCPAVAGSRHHAPARVCEAYVHADRKPVRTVECLQDGAVLGIQHEAAQVHADDKSIAGGADDDAEDGFVAGFPTAAHAPLRQVPKAQASVAPGANQALPLRRDDQLIQLIGKARGAPSFGERRDSNVRMRPPALMATSSDNSFSATRSTSTPCKSMMRGARLGDCKSCTRTRAPWRRPASARAG